MSSGLLDMQGVGGSSPLVLTSLNVPEAFIYKGFGAFFAFLFCRCLAGEFFTVVDGLWTKTKSACRFFCVVLLLLSRINNAFEVDCFNSFSQTFNIFMGVDIVGDVSG